MVSYGTMWLERWGNVISDSRQTRRNLIGTLSARERVEGKKKEKETGRCARLPVYDKWPRPQGIRV
jgi:hypothetical protein